MTLFKEAYESTAKHRKLTWMYALGSCILKANFPKKTLELVLVPFQVVVLLLFNSGAPPCPLLHNARIQERIYTLAIASLLS